MDVKCYVTAYWVNQAETVREGGSDILKLPNELINHSYQ